MLFQHRQTEVGLFYETHLTNAEVHINIRVLYTKFEHILFCLFAYTFLTTLQ
jgi:hypothetical protein